MSTLIWSHLPQQGLERCMMGRERWCEAKVWRGGGRGVCLSHGRGCAKNGGVSGVARHLALLAAVQSRVVEESAALTVPLSALEVLVTLRRRRLWSGPSSAI